MKIAHCDIKLENIIVSQDQTVKLDNFEFGTSISSKLMTPLGTLPYCAPEIINHSQGISPGPLDVFALGIVLLVSLLGRYPFKSASNPADSNYKLIK